MNLPTHTVVLRTYPELESFAGAFAQGRLNLLIVLGGPGLGKTRALRQAVRAPACFIEGHTTPFAAYRLIAQHLDQPIVIDDADSLFQNHEGIRLLKALCQTDAVKHVTWQSDHRALAREGIPRELETTSKVAVVANQWCPPNADVAALEDRGHLVEFQPDALEVHRRTATWFWCQEVFDFLGANLNLVSRPSMRLYRKAWELREAGLDWKGLTLEQFLQGKTLQVAKLKADPRFTSEEARAAAFQEAGHGCRATYFNHARKLPAAVEAPRIVLAQTTPPTDVAVRRAASLCPQPYTPPGRHSRLSANGRGGRSLEV